MIRGIAFDMDGLMFDTERLAVDAWMLAAEELGYHIPYAVVAETFGMTGDLTREVLYRHYGRDFDCECFFKVYRKHREALLKKGIRVKPGLVRLLDYLRENGYRYTVSTSSHEKDARRNFAMAGISDYFAEIVCGDKVARSKPAPDIYLKACEVMQLPADACLALEDSPLGLQAAAAAGLKPVFIPDLAEIDARTKRLLYAKVDSLADVISLLEKDRVKSPGRLLE